MSDGKAIKTLRWNVAYVKGRFFRNDGSPADDELGMSIGAMEQAISDIEQPKQPEETLSELTGLPNPELMPPDCKQPEAAALREKLKKLYIENGTVPTPAMVVGFEACGIIAQQAEQLAGWQEETERLRKALSNARSTRLDLQQQLAAPNKEIERLKKYARHTEQCSTRVGFGPCELPTPCDCGLNAVTDQKGG